METALLVLAAIALFINVTAIILMSVILIQSVRDMRDIRTMTQINTGKISGIDKLIVAVHAFLAQEMVDAQQHRAAPQGSGWDSMPIGQQEDGKFITEDGVHRANSFEELIGKITKDPRYRVNRPEDIDEIRQKFDEYNEAHGDGFPDDHGMEPPDGPVAGDEWKDSL